MKEQHNSFEVGVAEDGSTRYSLSVKESQGFQWNPDLFVSKYYQHDYCGYSESLYGRSGRDGNMEYDDHSRPKVHEIVVDAEEDIFPSDY
jgi:hypothetical protein